MEFTVIRALTLLLSFGCGLAKTHFYGRQRISLRGHFSGSWECTLCCCRQTYIDFGPEQCFSAGHLTDWRLTVHGEVCTVANYSVRILSVVSYLVLHFISNNRTKHWPRTDQGLTKDWAGHSVSAVQSKMITAWPLVSKTWKCRGILRMSGKSHGKWEKWGNSQRENSVRGNYCCSSVAICSSIVIRFRCKICRKICAFSNMGKQPLTSHKKSLGHMKNLHVLANSDSATIPLLPPLKLRPYGSIEMNECIMYY